MKKTSDKTPKETTSNKWQPFEYLETAKKLDRGFAQVAGIERGRVILHPQEGMSGFWSLYTPLQSIGVCPENEENLYEAKVGRGMTGVATAFAPSKNFTKHSKNPRVYIRRAENAAHTKVAWMAAHQMLLTYSFEAAQNEKMVKTILETDLRVSTQPLNDEVYPEKICSLSEAKSKPRRNRPVVRAISIDTSNEEASKRVVMAAAHTVVSQHRPELEALAYK